jgi:hypothetical protein
MCWNGLQRKIGWLQHLLKSTIPYDIYIFVKTCVVFTNVLKDTLQSIKDKHVFQKV